MENSTNTVKQEKSPMDSSTPPDKKADPKLEEALERSTQRTLETMIIAAREKKAYN